MVIKVIIAFDLFLLYKACNIGNKMTEVGNKWGEGFIGGQRQIVS